MEKNRIGIFLFFIGVAILLMGQYLGLLIEPTYEKLGAKYIEINKMWFKAYYLSFPFGLIFTVFGAIYASLKPTRVWLFILSVFVALIVYEEAQLIADGYPNPLFFGIGGNLILLMILGTIWYLARNRSIFEGKAQIATNFQIISCIFFAFAVWSTCGIGGFPFYALYAEKMEKFHTQPLLFPLLAKIMVFFVLGWFFMLLSQLKTAQFLRENSRIQNNIE